MRIPHVFLSTLLLICSVIAQDAKPVGGRVPDEASAVKAARAVLVPLYGKKQIESEEPFSATLANDVWTVAGTLHCPVEHCLGGAAVVKISKSDGRIISIYHPK